MPFIWTGPVEQEQPKYTEEELERYWKRRAKITDKGRLQSEDGWSIIPGTAQWKILQGLHQSFHLGAESIYQMASRLFEGKNVMKTLKNMIKRYEVHQKLNPKTEKLAISGLQWNGKYPGEGWEIDFTHMPKANWYSCLQVWLDTFTGWIEAFPCCSEQAKEVIKILIHEIIPRFGLPWSLQSDNGSAFQAALTQQVSKPLEIECHLYCSGRPQSSGKVEKANDIIKRHLHKLTQETQDNWIKVLPTASMRAWTAPQKEGISPFEGIYWRTFLCTDVIDPEALELTNQVTQPSTFQKVH